MQSNRHWYWIGQLVDPREQDKTLLRMFSSLAFMPETLILEGPDLCFFKVYERVPSQCVIVGGSKGKDSLDHTTVALQRIEDAATALTIVTHSNYRTTLLDFGLDKLPVEFLPSEELFRQSGYGRCPPLSPETAAEVKGWYKSLRNARNARNNNKLVESAITMSMEALTTNNKFKGVLLYAAFEELCYLLGGTSKAKGALKFSDTQRNQIERARRPIAHGGMKAKLQEPQPISDLLAEATIAFHIVFRKFLDSIDTSCEVQA